MVTKYPHNLFDPAGWHLFWVYGLLVATNILVDDILFAERKSAPLSVGYWG